MGISIQLHPTWASQASHVHSPKLRLVGLFFHPKAPCKSVQTARSFRTPRPRRLASPQLAS